MGGQQAKQLFPVPGKQRVGLELLIIVVLGHSNLKNVLILSHTPN